MQTTAHTSAAAFHSISNRSKKTQGDAIFDVVLSRCRNGAKDMSLQEIAYAYEADHGKRINTGTVAARVKALIDAKRLVRQPGTERPCAYSRVEVLPVTVPAHQDRMFY